MRHIFAAIGGAMLLAGCSDGLSFDGLNPANWFDDSGSMSSTDGMTKVDNRDMVANVTDLTMNSMGDSGIIIAATGVAPAQGYWDPVLVATNDEMPLDGFLTYEFRASAPMDESDGEMQSANEDDSYQLQAARTLTVEQLEGVIGIRVIGLGNHQELIL